MTTGLAGCGRMGLPMALSMQASGIPVLGFDIRTTGDFADLPMTFQPDHFGKSLKTLFSVVRDEDQTDALLFNTQAVINKAPNLEHLVICSTLSPQYVRDLRQRVPAHIKIVDAPMSGAAIAASQARLTFIIGGDETAIDEMMLYFSAMGDKIHTMGPYGSGMTAKALNNLVAASSVLATRQALKWGQQQGIDAQRLLHVIHDSSGQTWFGSNFGQIEFARDGFGADNTIGILAKDVACAATLADGPDPFTPALIEAIRHLEPFDI